MSNKSRRGSRGSAGPRLSNAPGSSVRPSYRPTPIPPSVAAAATGEPPLEEAKPPESQPVAKPELAERRSDAPPKSGLDEEFFEEGVKSDPGKPRQEATLVPKVARDDSRDDARDGDGVTDPGLLHKMQPEVRARRARYARYVTAVSMGCALLALAALVKHKAARGAQEAAAREMAAYAAAHAQENATPPPATPSAVPAPLAGPSEPKPLASAAAAQAPAQAAEPSAAAPAGAKEGIKPSEVVANAPIASTQPTDVETPQAKTAAQEKRDCQVLLDRGAFGRAIDAGQRSVALDPTDGEAWLLLGAAYQSLGRVADARRSFNACLKQGKKGPLGECKSMLQ